MTDNPEGSLTVLRCKTCNGDNQLGETGNAMVLHLSGCEKSEIERISVIPLFAVQERERELVERIEKAHAELIKPYSPLSVIVAQGHLEEALAYHRRESEDG